MVIIISFIIVVINISHCNDYIISYILQNI